MQHFFAVESARPTRGAYTFEVYRSNAKGIHWITSGKFYYGMTRGDTSEVLDALARAGAVPKKYKSTYYEGTTRDRYGIRYIVPKNQSRS